MPQDRPDGNGSGNRQSVGHRELAETLVVEVGVKGVLRGVQALSLHLHRRRGGGLVIAGSGGDVQVQQGAVQPGTAGRPVGVEGGLERDGLDEIDPVVEGVVERDRP